MKQKGHDEKKKARQFGAIGFIIFGAVAAFSYMRGHHVAPYIFGGLSAFLFIVRFIATPLMLPVYTGWMAFGKAVGWVNTNVLLTLAYFFAFAPVGLFMRLIGKDPMTRRFDVKAVSYWQPRAQRDIDPKRYEQRF